MQVADPPDASLLHVEVREPVEEALEALGARRALLRAAQEQIVRHVARKRSVRSKVLLVLVLVLLAVLHDLHDFTISTLRSI